MLDKVARSETGKVALGEAIHDETGETMLGETSKAMLFKIRAKVGMWWRRIGMAFQEVMSSEIVADLNITTIDQTLETL